MEDGIADSGGSSYFRVNKTADENFHYTLDKTWAEIKNAVDNGNFVMSVFEDEMGTTFEVLSYIGYDESIDHPYRVITSGQGTYAELWCDAPNEYPNDNSEENNKQ